MTRCYVGGREYRYPKITVNMTDRDVVERAAKLLGGNKIYPLPPSKQGIRKPAFRASVTGWKAAELMKDLYLWMGERRKLAIDNILMEYQAREPTQVRRSRSCSTAATQRSRRADGTFEKATA